MYPSSKINTVATSLSILLYLSSGIPSRMVCFRIALNILIKKLSSKCNNSKRDLDLKYSSLFYPYGPMGFTLMRTIFYNKLIILGSKILHCNLIKNLRHALILKHTSLFLNWLLLACKAILRIHKSCVFYEGYSISLTVLCKKLLNL